MDFDSIFPLLIFLLFFVLPSLLKKFKRPGKNPKKNTIFSKIGEKIRLFIKEIEQQRQEQLRQQDQSQQDQTNTTSSGIWETLAQEDEDYPLEQEKEPKIYESESIKPFQEDKLPDTFNEVIKEKPVQIMDKTDKKFKQKSIQTISGYKSNQLQNAVIWSEILGKPVALREE